MELEPLRFARYRKSADALSYNELVGWLNHTGVQAGRQWRISRNYGENSQVE
jgi:hypothetical protein